MDVVKKNVGIEIVDESVEIVDKDLVAKASAQHIGKYGSLKLTLEGKFEFVPLAHNAIDKSCDFIEKKIPGDQTLLFEGIKVSLKGAISKIKF